MYNQIFILYTKWQIGLKMLYIYQVANWFKNAGIDIMISDYFKVLI